VDPFFKLDDVWVMGEGNGNPILHDISWEVVLGSRWAVVGRSGAGKSTLLRVLNRMTEPSRGTVAVDGRSVTQIPPAELRRQVALVFQEPIWLPGTARDNLFTPARLKLVGVSEVEERLDEVLDLIGLGRELLERSEDELSVGQRQRVVLGRALMTRPRALLLDEPTAALDPPGAKALLEQIMKLGEAQNLTSILVTHRLSDARLFGARTVVLEGGRLVEHGETPEVLARLESSWDESES
jgi:D-methionine transport system ATP-binding protein